MTDSPLSDETLWRVVDLLDRRPENAGKTLEELIRLATRTIIRARKIVPIEENNFHREEFEKHFKASEPISEAEIARAVTGDRHKQRAVQNFRALIAFLMVPENDLIGSSENLAFLAPYLESREWPKGWVDYFRKLFPEWQKFKRSIVQPRTKKRKKLLALT